MKKTPRRSVILFSRLMAGILLAGFVFLTYTAAQWGWARFLYLQAYDKTVQTPEVYERAFRAAALDQNDPNYPALLGLFAQRDYANSKEMRVYRLIDAKRAQRHFIQALQRSPAKPQYWTNILIVKDALKDYGAEFRHALRMTMTLGPVHPGVHQVVINIGVKIWPRLPADEQQLVLQALEASAQGIGIPNPGKRILKTQAEFVRKTVTAHRRTAEVCAATAKPELFDFCKKN